MGARRRHLAFITLLMVSSAVATHSQSRDSSIYAEIVGSRDVVVDLKNDAIARGWKIVCEQPSGSKLTLRVRMPAGTPEDVIESFWGRIQDMRHYSVAMIYRA